MFYTQYGPTPSFITTIYDSTNFVVGSRLIVVARIFGITITTVVISVSMRPVVLIVMCLHGGATLSLAWTTRRYRVTILAVSPVSFGSGE